MKMRQIGLIKISKILAIIKRNKFNHKNKIGKFKYNDIVNNINDNNIIVL